MKKNIHPKYESAKVKCVACDHMFEIKSSLKNMTVTMCSNCHPLYSGGIVETRALGRIERFNRILKNKSETK